MNQRFFLLAPASIKVFLLTYFYKPSLFLIETINTCNLYCKTCPWHTIMKRKKEIMTFSRYKKIFGNIDQQAKKVCLYVLGEPFLNPDIFKIISYTESNKVKTIISSNGMLINRFINQIFMSKLSCLQIAFDGWGKGIHEKHRIGSNFGLIKKNVRNLSDVRKKKGFSKPEITIQMLVNKLNEDEIEKVKDFASKYVDHFVLKKMMFGRNKKTILENRKLFEPQNKKLKRLGKEYKYFKNMPICPQLLQVNVLVDGSVVPCCYDFDGKIVWGNLTKESFEKIIKGKKRKKFLKDFFARKSSLCKNCDFVKDMQIKIF